MKQRARIYYTETDKAVGRKNSIGAAKLPIGTHDATRRERVSR